MFRRRRRQAESPEVPETGPADASEGAEADAAPASGATANDDSTPAERPRPQGPWDVEDAPADPEGAQRLDLGGIRVPVVPGLELRIDMDSEQKPVSATVVSGASAMQVNAFAAPRSEGIWAEVRAEILASLKPGGAREVEGPFGPEVLSKVPVGPAVPGRGVPVTDARFLGVDGPRWFLRGLLSGPAAADPALAGPFEEVLRGVVVVRGSDAMAPRQPLPLTLPRQVQEAAAAQAQQQAQQQAAAAQQAQLAAQQQAVAQAQAQLAAQQQAAAQQGAARQAVVRPVVGDGGAAPAGGAPEGDAPPGAEAPPPHAGPPPAAPRLSMADQLAQAARAVAARQAGGSTPVDPDGGRAAGPPSTPPRPAGADDQTVAAAQADEPPAGAQPGEPRAAAPADEPGPRRFLLRPDGGPATDLPETGPEGSAPQEPGPDAAAAPAAAPVEPEPVPARDAEPARAPEPLAGTPTGVDAAPVLDAPPTGGAALDPSRVGLDEGETPHRG